MAAETSKHQGGLRSCRKKHHLQDSCAWTRLRIVYVTFSTTFFSWTHRAGGRRVYKLQDCHTRVHIQCLVRFKARSCLMLDTNMDMKGAPCPYSVFMLSVVFWAFTDAANMEHQRWKLQGGSVANSSRETTIEKVEDVWATAALW